MEGRELPLKSEQRPGSEPHEEVRLVPAAMAGDPAERERSYCAFEPFPQSLTESPSNESLERAGDMVIKLPVLSELVEITIR